MRRRAERRAALVTPRRPEHRFCALEHEADLSPRRAHAILRPTQRPARALPLLERQRQLAREVLPLLLITRAGLEEIDAALRDLSDDELRAPLFCSPRGV
jgi:hypothetical protein